MDERYPTAPVRRWWLRRWLNRLEVDRATFYAISARAWQFLAGPVTMLLIAQYFTPEVQGYYYTFWSLLALRTFADIGFLLVIVYVASHEWAHLELDADGRVVGNQSALNRLKGFARLVVRWYGAAASLFTLCAGAVGLAFFSQKPTQISWQAPWLTLVVVAGIGLFVSAFVAFLEGCNQVRVVYRFRVIQAVVGNVVVWICVVLGAGLWVAVAACGAQLLCDVYLVAVHYRRMWSSLWKTAGESDFGWSTDVWPLQWKLAVQSVFHYLGYHLFTPVLFHYHGAVLAGRMGMTWSALTAFQSAAISWVQTRTPLFGILVARKDYRELDRVFFRLAAISLGVLLVGGVALCGVVWSLNTMPYDITQKLADRLLPPKETIVFTAAIVLLHVPMCQAMYLRAHKRDPFLWLSMASNTGLGLAVWQLGSRYGALAAGWGLLAIVAGFTAPVATIVWHRCRREWHGGDSQKQPTTGP